MMGWDGMGLVGLVRLGTIRSVGKQFRRANNCGALSNDKHGLVPCNAIMRPDMTLHYEL